MSEDDTPPAEITYPYLKDGKLVFRPRRNEPYKYPAGTPEGDEERYQRHLIASRESQRRRRATQPKRTPLTNEERSQRNREAARKSAIKRRAAIYGVSVEDYLAGIESGLYPADRRKKKPPAKPAPQPIDRTQFSLNHDTSKEYVFNGTVRQRKKPDALDINPISQIATNKINPLDTGYLSDSYWNKFKNPKIPGRSK